MDELEKIMRDNSAEFLNQEPSVGHFERFDQKLARQNRKGKIIRMSKKISRIAAIGLLVLMSSMWAFNEFSQSGQQHMKLGDISQEYQEVEFFFTNQIDSRYENIQNCQLIESKEYKTKLLEELNQMDSIYENLQQELGANPNDERIIQAMIQHYQTKLKIMSDILNRLQSIQKIKNPQTINQNQYESVEL
ncbi:MAG: hypothetical protein KAH17_04805 [Bacteroidales bacterium]|nr:hypothetical protein [Bacteroidales bacterium]